ncbi:MAG: response regulator [Myxococcota bacterium]
MTFSLDVLVVDDNLINLKVAQRMFERMGVKIDAAHNGREAVEKARTHRYDLIFMDMQMPEMDGLTATREIVRKAAVDLPPSSR